jgi:hypothetical protein
MALHEKIQKESLKQVRWYRKEPIPEVPVPRLGPDLIDMRRLSASQAAPEAAAENVETEATREPA